MSSSNRKILIAGAGIGGMAAACALSQNNQAVQVIEQAHTLSEFGAGIQLAPNAVRVLQYLNLMPAYQQVATFPSHLQVHDGIDARELGKLKFDAAFSARYAAPYTTVHRADLHRILCAHAEEHYGIVPTLSQRLISYTQHKKQIHVAIENSTNQYQADALIGADGLHSHVRRQLLAPEKPRYSGVLAYRACVEQSALPPALRSQCVTAWLAPNWHLVHYPVCAGTQLNIVFLVHGTMPNDMTTWNHDLNTQRVAQLLHQAAHPIQQLISHIPHWRLWALCDRPPITSAHAMAQNNIALLGDAAHPMRPFMAQGAGMALEDAAVLAQQLQQHKNIENAFASYAQQRWQRCARVQQRSIRNGVIFHHTGFMMHARNLAMRTLGSKIMDVPWLYGKGAFPVH